MAKNLLVINCDIRETRVALIENGIIAELHLERESQVGTLGNIYLGKVSRVLPGMQAAFIDIGLERAAFLHVEDLIRPDDFEAYLAGHRTAMGGAQEAKSDGANDAPTEDEADGKAPDAATPAAAHAPGVARGGVTAPAAAAREGEGGERRGRRRRRGRGRRGADDGRPGDAPREAGADEAGADETGPDEAGSDEARSADAGHEGALQASFDGMDGDDVHGDDVHGDDELAGPASGVDRAEPRATTHDEGLEGARAAADDARDEATAAEAVAAAQDPAAQPPAAEAAAAAGAVADEDAPTPSRRRRSRRTRSTTKDVERAEGDRGDEEPPRSGEAPASIDAFAVEFGTDVAEAVQREGELRSELRLDDPAGGTAAESAGARADAELAHAREELGHDALVQEELEGEPGAAVEDDDAEAGVLLEDEGVLEPPAAGGEAGGDGGGEAGAPEDQAGTRARRARRGRARTRKSGSTADRREKMAAVQAAPPASTPSSQRKAKAEPLRVSKSTPIREVVREGQEVIVQVSKEPIGTKGARVTSHVSLPGRYVVYLPTVEHVGISKRIGSDKERSRLRAAIDAMKPPTGGLIVRTLAEGLTKKDLKNDVGYLVRLWGEVIKKREASTKRAPDCLYTELDIVLRTARDLFTDDIEKIIIDDRQQYERLKRFIEMFMPERVGAIELYEGSEPIFDEYGIEEEIGRALARKVPLESGGYLIIDQAEALTAIDVNTGKFVGKGSTDLEDTILKTNLEAVQEIAYQLRFRNLGGLIVLDLIDMEKAANREKVRRRLEELLAKDKAKTTLNRISDLGLIEMTRKRTRESLSRTMNEPCFYCDGTGNLQSKQTIAYEILRQIKREKANLRGYVVVVNAHPAVVDLLKHEERAAVHEAERRYQRRIDLVPRKEYHLEQFDLVGR